MPQEREKIRTGWLGGPQQPEARGPARRKVIKIKTLRGTRKIYIKLYDKK